MKQDHPEKSIMGKIGEITAKDEQTARGNTHMHCLIQIKMLQTS